MAAATTSDCATVAAVPLHARDLACRRGERLLFRNLDLEVLPGQILWVRGANGCGKTSLLRLLAGLARPDAGTVRRGDGARLFVGHANALKDDLTALESLMFLQQLHGGRADRADCEHGLLRMGLQARRHAPVRTLSQGQRRRVALARLFIERSASLWILDEPFDSLDAQSAALIHHALGEHARAGGATVLTSHLDLCVPEFSPITLHLDGAAYR